GAGLGGLSLVRVVLDRGRERVVAGKGRNTMSVTRLWGTFARGGQRGSSVRAMVTCLATGMLIGLLSSCDSGGPEGGAAMAVAQPGPSPQTLSDQAHENGQKGFFWLPPLVAAPTLQGTFDPSQSPVVTITPLTPGASPIATYTLSSGSGGETVHVDTVGQSYG